MHIDIYSKKMVFPLVAMFCLRLIQDNICSWQTNFECNAK